MTDDNGQKSKHENQMTDDGSRMSKTTTETQPRIFQPRIFQPESQTENFVPNFHSETQPRIPTRIFQPESQLFR